MSTAAGASAISPPLYVWIKLVTRELDNFAKIIIQPGSHVADVASLSCSTLEWGGLRANNVNIYLVIESSSDDPSTASITEALNRAPLRTSSDVKSGSWLVAKPIQLSSMTSTVSTVTTGSSNDFQDLRSMLSELAVGLNDQKSILASLLQQNKLEDFNFSSVSNRCVSRALSALNIGVGGNLLLPDLSLYMPSLESIRPYEWGFTERESTASQNLLSLLTTWVTFDSVPHIANRFFDVQSLASRSCMEVFVESVGTFRGMPDAVVPLSTVGDFYEIQPISSSTIVSIDWRTPSAFLSESKVNSIGHIQAIAFANLSQRSVPVFITDMSTGFKCWIVIDSKMYYLHHIDGQCLSLTEGVALMRYFLVRSEVIGSTPQNINGSLSHCVKNKDTSTLLLDPPYVGKGGGGGDGGVGGRRGGGGGGRGAGGEGAGRDGGGNFISENGGHASDKSSKGSFRTRKHGGGYMHKAFSTLATPLHSSVSDNEDDDISPETIREIAIALARGGGMRFDEWNDSS